jgi:hypothetical protein
MGPHQEDPKQIRRIRIQRACYFLVFDVIVFDVKNIDVKKWCLVKEALSTVDNNTECTRRLWS